MCAHKEPSSVLTTAKQACISTLGDLHTSRFGLCSGPHDSPLDHSRYITLRFAVRYKLSTATIANLQRG
jgi:hypothetical protein